jgi:flagellar basal body L-ring protein FlgH
MGNHTTPRIINHNMLVSANAGKKAEPPTPAAKPPPHPPRTQTTSPHSQTYQPLYKDKKPAGYAA